MLKSLQIKNFLLIDNLEINFKEGFTAIIGDTGSGKSIILYALLLTLGEKFTSKQPHQNITLISSFIPTERVINFLQSLSIDVQEELIIRRHISNEGKSKFYVNDIAIGAKVIYDLKDLLLEVSGQHSSYSLLNVKNHLHLLDSFIKDDTSLINLKRTYEELRVLQKEVLELEAKNERKEIDQAYLQQIIDELEELNISDNEEEELLLKRKEFQNIQKNKQSLMNVQNILHSKSIFDNLYTLQKELQKAGELFAKCNAPIEAAISELKELEAQVEEVNLQMSQFTNLEEVEQRLLQIRGFCRKYNILSNSISDFWKTKAQELNKINLISSQLEEKQNKLYKVKERYFTAAKAISQKRTTEAQILSATIKRHLQELMMEKVETKILVESSLEYITQYGIDKVKFMVKTNIGLDYANIEEVASGGELSRIMLAIKVALSESGSAPILIFDEIDSGISGAVSTAVGKKLSQIAKNSQVIAITHQPQVVGLANNYLHIFKVANDENTKISAQNLEGQEKLYAIARMIWGNDLNPKVLEAASDLMVKP